MKSRIVFSTLVLAGLLVSGIAAAPVLVRVQATSYAELYDHIPFKAADVDIAGVQVDASGIHGYDLMLDEADLPLVKGCGLATEVITRDLRGWRTTVQDPFANYNSYAELVAMLRNYAASYPQIVTLDSIGPSYENRWIYGIRLTGAANPDAVPQALIFGQCHAREWAAGQVVRHIADTLIKNYLTNMEFQTFINNHAVWLFPVTNPDGFTYDYPSQRSWRKNRHPFGGAIGTDINRSFNGCCNGDNMGDWGALVNGSRTSHAPNSDVFMGANGSFCAESWSLSEFFKRHSFVAVISFHSYSELVLWPYGHGPKTPDDIYYANLGRQIAGQIRRLSSGTYTPQQGVDLYPTNGGSDDWMYGWAHYIGGFPCMSFTFEVGTSFYQATSDLPSIQTQNFKGAWALLNATDDIINQLDGVVPRPLLYARDTASTGSFTLSWSPIRPEHNHPDKWELEELTGLTVVTDDIENGAGNWTLLGASVSSTQKHSGTNSIFLGNTSNMSNYAVTKDPYPVASVNDSVTFWVYHNLENNYDVGVVEVSLEGKEWIQLNNAFTGNSSGWQRKAYALAPWLGRSVYIRFRAMSDDNTNSGGMYVDDIAPVPIFPYRLSVSSDIADTMYEMVGKMPGHYWYRVRGHNAAWGWGDFGPLEDVVVVTADVAEPAESNRPESGARLMCQPNPFSDRTTIRYSSGKSGQVAFAVYSASGKLVRHLTFRDRDVAPTTGAGTATWDGRDDNNQRVPAGVYVLKLEADRSLTQRLLLVH